MSTNAWTDIHNDYKKHDWISQPSIFAELALSNFPPGGSVLELGAGLGQDSIFFAQSGMQVISTDIELAALHDTLATQPKTIRAKITPIFADLREKLPFNDNEFDAVYAHLSLHYFDTPTTKQLFHEITRILKSGGTLAFFTNSTSDPEFNTGEKLEDNLFRIGSVTKRYLTAEQARSFASDFEPIISDNKGETYKDADKGIHNLIRFIGTKKA